MDEKANTPGVVAAELDHDVAAVRPRDAGSLRGRPLVDGELIRLRVLGDDAVHHGLDGLVGLARHRSSVGARVLGA